MARVTDAEVREIFDTDIVDLTAFITAANLLVNNTAALSTNPSVDAATLKEIERWIAAHLASIRDPIALRQKIGDSDSWNFPAAVTTAWKLGLGLTPYGQQALMLDTSGSLASLGNQRGSYKASRRENSTKFTPGLD